MIGILSQIIVSTIIVAPVLWIAGRFSQSARYLDSCPRGGLGFNRRRFSQRLGRGSDHVYNLAGAYQALLRLQMAESPCNSSCRSRIFAVITVVLALVGILPRSLDVG